jgi:predicted amidohydrolase YtcJ
MDCANGRIFLLVLLFAAPSSMANAASRADLILYNGKVFTSRSERPQAEAIAIRGDRILAVGSNREIQALSGIGTKRIDLGGRLLIPGLNDAHYHLSVAPTDTIEVKLGTQDPTWEELKTALTDSVTSTPSGTLLLADVGATVFNDKGVDRAALDTVTMDRPVILGTLTGHAEILNTPALARAGVDEVIRDPAGGRFERDATGRLTGVAREYAVLQVDRQLASLTSDVDAERQLHKVLERAAEWGITSIQDMSDGIEPGRAVRLLSAIPTTIRVRVIRMPLTTPAGRDLREGRFLAKHPAPLISVSGTKWFLDGVPMEFTFDPRGSHDGAALPFDESVRILPMIFKPQELTAMLREALQNNDQLLLHVAGYPATAAMLTAMEQSGGARVWAARRVRFEHGDGLLPDLIPRAKALGIVVVQNPTHFVALGEEVVQFAQPVKSLSDAGITVAFGSDGPLNPYLNIMLAVTHPRRQAEGLTREQAVIAYTLGSAYAEFAERDKGTLEPGKLADLAVLSQNIFDAPISSLPETRALLTLVGGHIAYDAHVLGISAGSSAQR